MMGHQDRDQGQLFYEFKLDEVVAARRRGRSGPMLSKNSGVSEVVGSDLTVLLASENSCWILGGQMETGTLDPTHAYASLGGGPSRRRAMVLRF